jgi:hypothetical protein
VLDVQFVALLCKQASKLGLIALSLDCVAPCWLCLATRVSLRSKRLLALTRTLRSKEAQEKQISGFLPNLYFMLAWRTQLRTDRSDPMRLFFDSDLQTRLLFISRRLTLFFSRNVRNV